MKKIIITCLLFTGLILVSFTKKNNITATSRKISPKDSIAIEKLVRNFFEWRFYNPGEFVKIGRVDVNNEYYIGIDWTKYDERKALLEKSNFFTKKFLNNYKKILNKIHKKLKAKVYEWKVDGAIPFGLESDEWCNCVDYPEVSEFWKEIKIKKLRLRKDGSIKLRWYWGDARVFSKLSHFSYKIEVRKEDGKWKFDKMEGFIKKNY